MHPPVLTCPTCRGPLTVQPSPVAYTVACPHCGHPLMVPAVATPVGPPAGRQSGGGSPFDFTQADERPGRAHRKKRSAGPWLWVGAVIAAVVLLCGGAGGVVLHVIATERHQMDSLYSEYTDEVDDWHQASLKAITDPELQGGDGLARGLKKFEEERNAVSAVRSKLWDDYTAKFGTDPKYVEWKHRARPNPMRARYPLPPR